MLQPQPRFFVMKYSGRKIKNNSRQDNATLRILLEAGLLKRIRRSGWWVVGIDDPETVAEHSFRTSIIGYFLAKQEGADAYRVLVMTLFNDLHEARINDLHKMGQRYIDFSSAEKKAFIEQIQGLEFKIKEELKNFRSEIDTQSNLEAVVARDADILECLLQAKEYSQQGMKLARGFFKKAPGCLKSKSARKLWGEIKNCKIDKWWQALSDFKR